VNCGFCPLGWELFAYQALLAIRAFTRRRVSPQLASLYDDVRRFRFLPSASRDLEPRASRKQQAQPFRHHSDRVMASLARQEKSHHQAFIVALTISIAFGSTLPNLAQRFFPFGCDAGWYLPEIRRTAL